LGTHRFEVPAAAAIQALRARPALAIWGNKDRTLDAEHFLPLFTALFPDAPVHRLPGAGHYCFEDAPDEITTLIADFLHSR
jgi:haloalkane dehalogenase